MHSSRALLLSRPVRRFTPGPPRHINEARFTTIDRKQCSFVWKNGSQIDITLQDRTKSITFPLNLRRDAGKFINCAREGGISSLADHQDPKAELRIGSDKGVLYFAMKGSDASITTGLAPAEAAIATALIKAAETSRIVRLM